MRFLTAGFFPRIIKINNIKYEKIFTGYKITINMLSYNESVPLAEKILKKIL